MKNFFQKIKNFFSNLPSLLKDGNRFSRKTKIVFLCVGILVLTLCIAGAIYFKAYTNSYSYITKLVNEKQYEIAYKKLSNILKKNPNDPFFLILAGKVSLGVSIEISDINLKKVYLGTTLDFLKRAEAINPNLIEIYNVRGLTYLYLGEATLSQNSYRRMLNIDSRSVDGWVGLGNAYLLGGDVNEAGKSFKKVLDFDPENEKAMLGNIKILALQNRMERVINLGSPLFAKVSNNVVKKDLAEILGRAYIKMAEYREAKRIFNEGLVLNPKSAPLNYGLAEVAFYSSFNFNKPIESTLEAKKIAEGVIRLDSSYPYSYALLTRISAITKNKMDYDKYLGLTKEKIQAYPLLNSNQKDIFIKTLPSFNKSSGNVTIRVKSVKSTPVIPGENK